MGSSTNGESRQALRLLILASALVVAGTVQAQQPKRPSKAVPVKITRSADGDVHASCPAGYEMVASGILDFSLPQDKLLKVLKKTTVCLKSEPITERSK